MTDTTPLDPITADREPTAIALADQVVVVSGGGRGLGAAISRAFLGQGARVAIGYYRGRDGAEALAAEYPGRGFAVPLDATPTRFGRAWMLRPSTSASPSRR